MGILNYIKKTWVDYASAGPYLEAANINPWESLLFALDNLTQGKVSGLTATPPGSPAPGETWLIDDGATGPWATHDGKIAVYSDSAWQILATQDGFTVHDMDGLVWTKIAGEWSSRINVQRLVIAGDSTGFRPLDFFEGDGTDPVQRRWRITKDLSGGLQIERCDNTGSTQNAIISVGVTAGSPILLGGSAGDATRLLGPLQRLGGTEVLDTSGNLKVQSARLANSLSAYALGTNGSGDVSGKSLDTIRTDLIGAHGANPHLARGGYESIVINSTTKQAIASAPQPAVAVGKIVTQRFDVQLTVPVASAAVAVEAQIWNGGTLNHTFFDSANWDISEAGSLASLHFTCTVIYRNISGTKTVCVQLHMTGTSGGDFVYEGPEASDWVSLPTGDFKLMASTTSVTDIPLARGPYTVDEVWDA